MLLIIKTQKDCDDAVNILRTKDNDNYTIYIHAHGSDKKNFFDVLRTMDNTEFIFITELANVMQDVINAGKNVYVVALSCYWNLKYDWGIPTPTVSVAPDTSTRLPYPVDVVENSLRNHLSDDVDKSVFLDWAQKLKEAFVKESSGGIWECYDGNGKLNTCASLRIIQI